MVCVRISRRDTPLQFLPRPARDYLGWNVDEPFIDDRRSASDQDCLVAVSPSLTTWDCPCFMFDWLLWEGSPSASDTRAEGGASIFLAGPPVVRVKIRVGIGP